MTKQCKKCLYTDDHPLNLFIDNEGICSGCRVHEEKYKIDWEEKEKQLFNLIKEYKKLNNNYDCIIPVSGSADSFFIVDYVVNKLNLNPLLVSYNNHSINKLGWQNLAILKTIFNLDHITKTTSPDDVKAITRLTMNKFSSIYWHIHAGKTVFPVQVAKHLEIPLIIWGENEATEQVGMYSYDSNIEMSRKYRREHILLGFEAEDLILMNEISEECLEEYIYPDVFEINKYGIRGIYLSNYIKWDNFEQNKSVYQKYKFNIFNHSRTYDPYQNIDCYLYMTLHDVIKYNKCGYSKVLDHLTRDIRHKRINRIDAQKINNNISKNNFSEEILVNFCSWIEIDKSSFLSFLENYAYSPFYINKNINYPNFASKNIKESQAYIKPFLTGDFFNENF